MKKLNHYWSKSNRSEKSTLDWAFSQWRNSSYFFVWENFFSLNYWLISPFWKKDTHTSTIKQRYFCSSFFHFFLTFLMKSTRIAICGIQQKNHLYFKPGIRKLSCMLYLFTYFEFNVKMWFISLYVSFSQSFIDQWIFPLEIFEENDGLNCKPFQVSNIYSFNNNKTKQKFLSCNRYLFYTHS
jgi:hypothetical protein